MAFSNSGYRVYPWRTSSNVLHLWKPRDGHDGHLPRCVCTFFLKTSVSPTTGVHLCYPCTFVAMPVHRWWIAPIVRGARMAGALVVAFVAFVRQVRMLYEAHSYVLSLGATTFCVAPGGFRSWHMHPTYCLWATCTHVSRPSCARRVPFVCPPSARRVPKTRVPIQGCGVHSMCFHIGRIRASPSLVRTFVHVECVSFLVARCRVFVCRRELAHMLVRICVRIHVVMFVRALFSLHVARIVRSCVR